MNLKFYLNVNALMENEKLSCPKCNLPRPKLKPTVLVTGWNEWLPLITLESEV